jgi:hypothetical protein
LKLEIRNWKFDLHAFVLFFPISNFYFHLSLISIFQFQLSSRERLAGGGQVLARLGRVGRSMFDVHLFFHPLTFSPSHLCPPTPPD